MQKVVALVYLNILPKLNIIHNTNIGDKTPDKTVNWLMKTSHFVKFKQKLMLNADSVNDL